MLENSPVSLHLILSHYQTWICKIIKNMLLILQELVENYLASLPCRSVELYFCPMFLVSNGIKNCVLICCVMLNELMSTRLLSCRYLLFKKLSISLCQLLENKDRLRRLWQDETKCNLHLEISPFPPQPRLSHNQILL